MNKSQPPFICVVTCLEYWAAANDIFCPNQNSESVVPVEQSLSQRQKLNATENFYNMNDSYDDFFSPKKGITKAMYLKTKQGHAKVVERLQRQVLTQKVLPLYVELMHCLFCSSKLSFLDCPRGTTQERIEGEGGEIHENATTAEQSQGPSTKVGKQILRPPRETKVLSQWENRRISFGQDDLHSGETTYS